MTNVPLYSGQGKPRAAKKISVFKRVAIPSKASQTRSHCQAFFKIKTKKQVKEGIAVTAKIHIFLPLYLDYTDLAILGFGS